MEEAYFGGAVQNDFASVCKVKPVFFGMGWLMIVVVVEKYIKNLKVLKELFVLFVHVAYRVSPKPKCAE